MSVNEKLKKILFYQEQKRPLLRMLKTFKKKERGFIYYKGFYTRFSILEEKTKEYLVEENQKDELLNKKDITGYSEEQLKEVIDARLDEIEKNQRVKELVTPSTYFFDTLFLKKMRTMIAINDLKENVQHVLYKHYTNNEIEEKAARLIKNRDYSFTGMHESIEEELFFVFSFLDEYFCLHVNKNTLISFKHFEKNKEEALLCFRKLCQSAYEKKLEEIMDLARVRING